MSEKMQQLWIHGRCGLLVMETDDLWGMNLLRPVDNVLCMYIGKL
jgi:hypothetical protein